MTDKYIENILRKLNNNAFEYEMKFTLLSEEVIFVETWLDKEKNPLNEAYKFYFIKVQDKYVGAVLDMYTDLHAYLSPKARGNGFLTKNLVRTIFPHLAKDRQEQKITISDLENIKAQNVVKSVGFLKINSESPNIFVYIKKFE